MQRLMGSSDGDVRSLPPTENEQRPTSFEGTRGQEKVLIGVSFGPLRPGQSVSQEDQGGREGSNQSTRLISSLS